MTSRRSSGSSRPARTVESTRSQNSTVSWRRCASGMAGASDGAGRRGQCRRWRGGWRSVCGGGERRREQWPRIPQPDENVALLVTRHVLGVDEFNLEVLNRLVIELELPLERTIGHPPPLTQE